MNLKEICGEGEHSQGGESDQMVKNLKELPTKILFNSVLAEQSRKKLHSSLL